MSDDVPYERNSATSQAAAVSLSAKTLGRLEALVLQHVTNAGNQGITDDELEVLTKLSHQTVSARRRGLVLQGLVKDSGVVRLTRAERKATVWVLGTEEQVLSPDGLVPARPSAPEIRAALAELRDLVRLKSKLQPPYLPSKELVKLGKWLSYEGDEK
jgi:hypothetical protein